MYSPLKHWGADKGKKTIGIIGIGGLGTMGIKLAKALGNEVMAISSSANKVKHFFTHYFQMVSVIFSLSFRKKWPSPREQHCLLVLKILIQ